MSDDSDELPTVMPLFPLPNVVALPGVALHLHVFEPRYRQMVGDLDHENPFLAMALIAKGHERSGERNPPVDPIVCAGRVTQLQPLEDGRYLMIFASLARARLLAEDQDSHLYRIGELSWLHPGEADEPSQLGLKLDVYQSFQHYAGQSDLLRDRLGELRRLNLPLGRLVDMLASCMPLDVELQRRMLEELDTAKRAVLLLTILRTVNGTRDSFPVH